MFLPADGVVQTLSDNLEIKDVSRTQAGRYMCVATNNLLNTKTGRGEKSIQVNINCKSFVSY